MKIVIIIPAFNEDATIKDVLRKIPKKIPKISKIETVVVDDGSTDKTKEISKSEGAIVISHRRNLGLGSVFRSGINYALSSGADIMVNIDADGQFNPKDIPKLIAPIADKKVDCTTASRFMDKSLYPDMNIIKFWGNHAMSFLISFLTRQKFHDVSCGMRAYNRHALLNFNLTGKFTYTQEAILNLTYKGITIDEIPIKVIGKRVHGKSKIASNLFRYTLRTSVIIFRAFRDYKPLMFFGIISLMFFIIAFSLFTFLGIHYLQTNSLFPHKWAGVAGITITIISFGCLLVGLVADMLDRIRMNQEKIIYLLQKNKIDE